MSGRIFHFNHHERDYKASFNQDCQLSADGILAFSHWIFEDNETGVPAFTETAFPYLLAIQKRTTTSIERMDHGNSIECNPELFQLVVYRLEEWLAERN